jgi:hypothetical protein
MIHSMKSRVAVIGAAVGIVTVGALLISTRHGSSAGPNPAPAALARARVAADALPAEFSRGVSEKHLNAAGSRRVDAQIWLVPSTDGRTLCMAGVHSGGALSMSCNPAGDFFNEKQLVWGISEQGQPSAPSSAEVMGVARAGVSTVVVHFGSATRQADVAADGGFTVTGDAAALAAGPPSSLDALDAGGKLLEHDELPTS